MDGPGDDHDDEEGADGDWRDGEEGTDGDWRDGDRGATDDRRDDDRGATDDWRDDEFDDPAALAEDDGGGGSVFGPRLDEGWEEILPGQPKPENVLFVLLGVVTTLVLVADLVGLF